MNIIVDTSVILAVLLHEPDREAVIAATAGHATLVPPSVPWETGNALVAGLRRGRLTLPTLERAWRAFEAMELRFIDVDIGASFLLAAEHGLYAYDAYFLEAARRHRTPLLTLDRRLASAAQAARIAVVEFAT